MMILNISFIINKIQRWHGICLIPCLTLDKEVKMRVKLFFALVGTVLILTSGVVFADDQEQSRDRNHVRVELKSQGRSQFQNGMMFMDENGDGICDGLRDHDSDGIPNGQDPDWTKPKDGTGNQFKNGNGSQVGNEFGKGNRNQSSKNQFGNKNEFRGGNNWNKQSFRQNRTGPGSSLCDSTGPKGHALRGGKR